MDWLRSEDLKEEKGLTTSKLTITRRGTIYVSQIDLLTVSVLPLSRSCRISGSKSEMPANCLERARRAANLAAKEFVDRPNPTRAKHITMPHLIWRNCAELLTPLWGALGHDLFLCSCLWD